MSTPERAGWFDDPEDDTQLRYFDGIIWSDRTVPRRSRRPEPAASPGEGAGAGGAGTDVFGRPVTPGHGAASPFGPTPPQHGGGHGHGAPTAPTGPASRPGEPTTADGQPLAPYGNRLGAYLIDMLIVGFANALLAGWAYVLWMKDYFTFVFDAAEAQDQARIEQLTPDELFAMLDWNFFFIGLGLTLLLQTLYQVVFLTTRGATPGKAMLGLSVRRADQPGRITVGTAFMRVLLPIAAQLLVWTPLLPLVLLLNPADVLWPIVDQKRQALHDKIAGTQVVVGRQAKRASQPPE